MPDASAVAGVSDHAGWAVVVCVEAGRVLDARRIELLEPGLPKLPHHHEAQTLPIGEATALIERVRASAVSCASTALDVLPAGVGAIAIRKRPALSSSLEERIGNYWAQCRADSVMYRDVLAETARARGWTVHEYDAKAVTAEAADVLGLDDVAAHLKALGKAFAPPWNKDHRLATSAAIVAAAR